MDKLKREILKAFNGYLRKVNRGYPFDKKQYTDIIEAMRMINAVENFTFSEVMIDTLVNNYTLKLRQ